MTNYDKKSPYPNDQLNQIYIKFIILMSQN